MTSKQKHELAVDLLDRAAEAMEERSPDPLWLEQYYTLTGAHMIMTEEGWEPGEYRQSYVDEGGEEARRLFWPRSTRPRGGGRMGGTIEVCHSCGNARHGISEAGCLDELRRKAGLWDKYVGDVKAEVAKADSLRERLAVFDKGCQPEPAPKLHLGRTPEWVKTCEHAAKDTVRRHGRTAEEAYAELRRIVKEKDDRI